MTTKKKGPGRARKLKLKKETLKDLDASRGKGIKGGVVSAGPGVVCHTIAATCFCTAVATNCKVSCVAVCGGGTLLG